MEQIRQSLQESGMDLTLHAAREALSERISVDDIRQVLLSGLLLEDYPSHPRGPCCLVYGTTPAGRNLHIVVTTQRLPVRVITVYEPTMPYWATPTQRNPRQ